jgi:hypothetical protein
MRCHLDPATRLATKANSHIFTYSAGKILHVISDPGRCNTMFTDV